MRSRTTYRYDHHDEDGSVTVDQLPAIAAAVGALGSVTIPPVASHRTGPGRRVPTWLLPPRSGRRGQFKLARRYLGLIGGVVDSAPILSVLPVLATAGLLGLVVGTAVAR